MGYFQFFSAIINQLFLTSLWCVYISDNEQDYLLRMDPKQERGPVNGEKVTRASKGDNRTTWEGEILGLKGTVGKRVKGMRRELGERWGKPIKLRYI